MQSALTEAKPAARTLADSVVRKASLKARAWKEARASRSGGFGAGPKSGESLLVYTALSKANVQYVYPQQLIAPSLPLLEPTTIQITSLAATTIPWTPCTSEPVLLPGSETHVCRYQSGKGIVER